MFLDEIADTTLAVLYNAGQYDSPMATKAFDYAWKHCKPTVSNDGHYFYTQLYMSQASWQKGDKFWGEYYPAIQRVLLRTQQRNGSWSGDSVGLAYGTSLALLILVAVVAATALELAPISIAALGGVAAMLATRCLDWEDAAGALSTRVVLLVASSLALGAALERTGATDWLAARFVAAVGALPAEWVLALLMLLMAAFTNFVSNAAAAAVGTPIAVGIAAQLGVSPEPLVLAILFGANFAYVTPMAYQTNVLVMSAAGYRFADFVRGGLPLLVLMLASYSLLLPRFFPL